MTRPVADVPDTIVLRRDRELVGRAWEIWARRGLFALLPLVVVLALLNLFGQRPSTVSATGSAATLEVYAPNRVRSGLLFEARFTIRAERELRKAMLILDPGWAEGLSINTIEPSPVGEASDDGKLALELGHVPAGEKYVLFMQLQVNPTNIGHRSQTATLVDGDETVAVVDKSITIFP